MILVNVGPLIVGCCLSDAFVDNVDDFDTVSTSPNLAC